MTLSVAEFVHRVTDIGLISSSEIDEVQQTVPSESEDAQSLARELVRLKKLTPYQAQAVIQGKTQALVLGNYTILGKLGEGGMGKVFKAQHRRMKRIVAVKIIPPGALHESDNAERFYREVEAAAKLIHANIVTAYDADEYKGVHFLVMEYVEGADLLTWVRKRGALPVRRALNCVIQAARGLEHAHTQGIVHRDVKPANLLLDRQGAIKVLDMGLASFRDGVARESEEPEPEEGLTRVDRIMGTVDYMAPEQAVNTRKADHRADIYALGCTLHFLLTGKTVFTGRTMMERVLAHREQPIPFLAERAKSIPTALDEIFHKMLAKRVEDRYQSMTEVLSDLESLIEGGGTRIASVVEPPPEDEFVEIFDELEDGEMLEPTDNFGHTEAGLPPRTSRRVVIRSQRLSPVQRQIAAGSVLLAGIVALVWAIVGLFRGDDEPNVVPDQPVVEGDDGDNDTDSNPDTQANDNDNTSAPTVRVPHRNLHRHVVDPPGASDELFRIWQLQGEYTGTRSGFAGQGGPIGLQVVARSKTRFDVLLYSGGLPGEKAKIELTDRLTGTLTGGAVVVKRPPVSGEIEDGQLLSPKLNAKRTVRRSPTVGKKAPRNAKLLFDGSSVGAFANGGGIDDDGWLIGTAATEETFGDFRLHLEFRTPFELVERSERARAAIVLQNRYRIVLCDSFGVQRTRNSCGSVAGIRAPNVNPAFPPRSWQTLDVTFQAARFDARGQKKKPAIANVQLNGVTIHSQAELPHETSGDDVESHRPGPIVLVHDRPGIVFRNIWIIE